MEAGPFRSLLYIGNGERSFPCSADTLPTGRGPLYPAGLFECPKGVAEAFVFDRKGVAERRSRACFARGKQGENLFLEISPHLVFQLSDDLQMGRFRVVGDKLEYDGPLPIAATCEYLEPCGVLFRIGISVCRTCLD